MAVKASVHRDYTINKYGTSLIIENYLIDRLCMENRIQFD